MTYVFRPSHYNVTDAAQARVYEPGGAALLWWNPDGATPAANVGAWQAKGAASLAASYLNLATLGNANIDPAVVGGVAPTWDAGTGWTFDGATQYLRTGIAVTTSNVSAILRFSDVVVGANRETGTQAATRFRFIFIGAAGQHGYYNGTVQLIVGGALTNGVMAISGDTAYYNGVGDGIITVANGNAGEFFLGALNNSGAPLFRFPGKIQAFAFYDLILTPAQALARYNAIAAL